MVKTVEWKKLLREILWRPGVVVMLALYGLLQLVSNFIAWTLSSETQAKYQFIKLSTWRVWLIATPILTIVLIALIIHSAYKVIAKRDAEHIAEVGRLDEEHKEAISQIKAEKEGLNSQLQEERAKNARPEIRGTIKQVYFQRLKKESAIDLTRYAIFVEALLTNFRPMATTVREFRVRLVTDHAEYEAPQAYPKGWGYEPEQKSEYATYALEGWQLKRDPQPAGYEQGRAQEGWLYFTRIISEIEVENVKKIILIAIDAFGTQHEIIGEPPWRKLGKIVPYPY